MFSVLFRKSFNGNGLVFGYQTKNSLLRISQLYSSVFLIFPIIRAISSIVTWLSFLWPTILSSSVCFTGTFTGTFTGISSFSNPLLSNGIVTVIVDVLKSYALAPYFLTTSVPRVPSARRCGSRLFCVHLRLKGRKCKPLETAMNTSEIRHFKVKE